MVDNHWSEACLRRAGLRPTRQRLMVANAIRNHPHSHMTAEDVHRAVGEERVRLSLATVYNALNEFAKAGLLRRLNFSERIFFCKNRAPHHHYLDVSSGRVFDIPPPQPLVDTLPAAPDGMVVDGVDIIVRIRPARQA